MAKAVAGGASKPGPLIGLEEAAPMMLGKGGFPPSRKVLMKWADRRMGCPTVSGHLVLPTVKVGGALYTTAEWVRAFEEQRRVAGRAPRLRQRLPWDDVVLESWPVNPEKARRRHDAWKAAHDALAAAEAYHKPQPPPPWTAEEDELVRTLTAREVAEATGRSAYAVTKRRKELGAPDARFRTGAARKPSRAAGK